MRVTSFFLLAFACAGQSDPVATGLEQFHRGEYRAAAKTLAASSDARAVTYRVLAEAATGGCSRVSSELQRQFDSQSDSELRRAAGIGLAQCAVARDQFETALPVLQSLRRLYPADADVLFLSAKLHMKAWNDAVYGLYRNAPGSFRVHQISGEIFEMQGRFQEAAAEYRKAIEKNPAALNLHFRLGRAVLLESRTPEALAAAQREFEAELKLNPGDAAAEYQVAQILVASQKAEDAAPRYERALSLDPAFLEARIALGRIRTDQRRYEEAVALLEPAVKQAPSSEAARYSLMLAYRNAGRSDDALRQKEAIEKLQQPSGGEFAEFLQKLGNAPARKQ